MEPTSGAAADEPSSSPDPVLFVAVTRTGGFAGLTRAWTAEPQRDEAPQWIVLISRCPWDEADDPESADPEGADRFEWSIRARVGPDDDRAARLPDRAVTGPWRELVDAVRDWSAPDEQGAARPQRPTH